MEFEAKGAEPAAGVRAETTLSNRGLAEADADKERLLLGGVSEHTYSHFPGVCKSRLIYPASRTLAK